MNKETNKTIVAYIRNYFRDIRNLFKYEEKYYYKAVRVGNFSSNNYIKYESNSDRNKRLEEYFNKIRPYLKYILNYLKNSDTLKIQLAIAIKYISSKYNDEKRVVHSKSDNRESLLMIKQIIL